MPDIYEHIVRDENIKALYTQIDKNSKILIDTFLNNRDNILTHIREFTKTSGGFIYTKGANEWGYEIEEHVKMLRLTGKLLADPGNSILAELRQ